MNNNEQKIDPIIWAVVFLAVIVAIATIAVTADAKKERYLIEVRTTDGDVKNNGGENDQEAKRRMVFPDNDYTADHRINDRVFQNRNLSAAPAGSAKSSEQFGKPRGWKTDSTDAVKTAKSGSVRLTAESSKEDFRQN